MTPSEIRAKAATGREFITCSRCRVSVELPANYCDMCGGRITQEAALDLPRMSERPAERAKDRPARLEVPVPEQKRVAPTVGSEAACRVLTSAHRILKGIDKAMESTETPVRQYNPWRALFSRIASRHRVQPEIAEWHRTLDLAETGAHKAETLDPEAIIETEGGSLNARALLSIVDRVRGNIEFLAGKPRDALRHFQSSIDRIETQETYFDMAVAYEHIGRPGEALRAYERCGEVLPDSEVGIDALDEAERLRSEMTIGGWFVGSWKIVIVLGASVLSGLLIMPMMPMVGILYLGISAAVLGLYCVARFKRRVSP